MFLDPHKTHKYSCVGQNVEFLNVKLAVRVVATVRYIELALYGAYSAYRL